MTRLMRPLDRLQDSPELRATGFVKGELIGQIMHARGGRSMSRYVLTRRRGANAAHTQMGRPTRYIGCAGAIYMLTMARQGWRTQVDALFWLYAR